MEQIKWIDIEVKRSKDLYCFQMSKFIIQLLRHKEVGLEEDAVVLHDRIVEKCKKVLSADSRCRSDELKEKLSTLPQWSTEKRWWTKEQVSIIFVPENYDFFDPFKVIQEKLIFEMLVSILHCKTMYCHQRILPSMFITSETERN